MGEEKRHQMMQNLFGCQSEDDEEVDSGHESNSQRGSISNEERGKEFDGEAEADGQCEVEIESGGDRGSDTGESDEERYQSGGGDRGSDLFHQRDANDKRMSTSRRVADSGLDRSEHHYADDEDDEVDQEGSLCGPTGEANPQPQVSSSAPEIRDVFGESDDDEQGGYAFQNDIDEPNRSPMEEDQSLRPQDVLADDDEPYGSEEENVEDMPKEKLVGPPLVLEIPMRPPPAHPDKMNMVKVSNIFGIDPKPFDPATYVEEDTFITDESGANKRIRLENNIVRWRSTKNSDGTNSYESNARFVRWSDGSLQLLIGNEVLDISVQDAQHDKAHLFLRHGKGILQSQGRLLRKMRFMPSSLSSNSHRLLTALVDSHHKKVYKVKNCVTSIDPEKEKEQKEKALSQSIRANELLNRKRERVSKKYMQTADRGRQLSPGFLEDALDEDEEPDYSSRRPASRQQYVDDLEEEARAEKRIMNAKKAHVDVSRKYSTPTVKSSRRPVDFSDSEREESEYESEEEVRSPPRKKVVEPEEEEEYEEEEEKEEQEQYEEHETNEPSEDAEERSPQGRVAATGQRAKDMESDEDSPSQTRRPTHRRMAVVYDSDED